MNTNKDFADLLSEVATKQAEACDSELDDEFKADIKEKWQIVFDGGVNKWGIRFIRYEGEIKGVDWSNYEVIETQPIIYYDKPELEKFRDEINQMINSKQLNDRVK